MDNGEPAFIDFQLAKHFSRKTFLFKLLKKLSSDTSLNLKNGFAVVL